MVLKNIAYSILFFTFILFIYGLIIFFNFRTYSLRKTAHVSNTKCVPYMEREFSSDPPSKKWTRIGDSRNYKKSLRIDNLDNLYISNFMYEYRRRHASDSQTDFYNECVYDVKYKVDNKNIKSKIISRYPLATTFIGGSFKKGSKIGILVNKNKPKEIIRVNFLHNFNPYVIFGICFILILTSIFLINMDSKGEDEYL